MRIEEPKIDNIGEPKDAKKKEKGVIDQISTPVDQFVDWLERKDRIVTPAEVDFSYLTPEQRAENLWAFYRKIRKLRVKAGNKEKATQEDKEDFDKQLSILLALYKDKEANTVFHEKFAEHYQEIESINGDREKEQELVRHREELRETMKDTARNIFANRSEGDDPINAFLYQSNKKAIEGIEQDITELVDKNPRLGALMQYETLQGYQKQLERGGFVRTPSREGILDKALSQGAQGKILLFHGPSGTGKNAIVAELAKTLTGHPHVRTTGKNERFRDMVYSKEIKEGSSYKEYGPLGYALTGRRSNQDTVLENKGSLLFDDEFNGRDEDEQRDIISQVYDMKPGKEIYLPGTTEKTTVAPNFFFCAAANIAGTKYKRKKIPLDVTRKMEPISVDYMEQTRDNPELYEFMLACLMSSNGRIADVAFGEITPSYEGRVKSDSIEKDGQQISRQIKEYHLLETEKDAKGRDVPAGGFLWRFAQVLNQLNRSIADKETVLKSRGEGQYMRELVMDIGIVQEWLTEYRKLKEPRGLEEFMVEKIRTRFIQDAAYPKEDKVLLKDFFTHYGIDLNKEEFEKKEFAVLTPVDIGKMSPRVEYYEVLSEDPVVTDFVHTIEGKPVKCRAERYEISEDMMLNPGDTIDINGEQRCYLGIRTDTEELVFDTIQS